MIFRQLFDSVSGTYSYLLASRLGGEALILDPVLEKAEGHAIPIVPEATVVPSGVVRLMELQEAGWSYVRP